MFNESLFLQFKQLLDQTFGENFFDITLVRTPDAIPIYDSYTIQKFNNNYCNKKGLCTPYTNYFICILKPIRIPIGTTIVVKIGEIGSKYHYYGYHTHRQTSSDDHVFVNELSDVLKKEPFKTLLRISNPNFKDLSYRDDFPKRKDKQDSELLSVDDVDFLYSLKGYGRLNKFSVYAEKRMRNIGNRFPKGNYQYLYRGISNGTFYNEIENSFETSCGTEEEILLEKDLSVNAKKYFNILVSGVRSWTTNKDVAKKYAYGHVDLDAVGGYVLLAWVRPPKEDIVIDVTPTLKYIHENSLSKGTSWALFNEILAEPKSAKIIGIKRWSNGKKEYRYDCNYVIYLKS